MPSQSSATTAFAAFEDTAAYVPATLTRAQAITEARDAAPALLDFPRRELRAVRVYMRPVYGAEAEEFFAGEFDTGWIECTKGTVGADPMWKVEPR